MISSNSSRVLLTGATGFVGRFMLARLLRSGVEVGVLVRSTPTASARQRVELALANFEQSGWLPRPRTIDGDLLALNTSLGGEDLAWLSSSPITIVHCAASIRFTADEVSGEPYRTNVEGTRQLLDLCQRLSVSAFHHVSTAYVGIRNQGNAICEELVSGDEWAGNDYERSKIRAERMIAECTWTGPTLIHRPSIVIGDTRTAFTSTFHGFYAPLQIAVQFARSVGLSKNSGTLFRKQLGIRSRACKNFVPVDWLSAAIAHCIGDTSWMRLTDDKPTIVHWTNPHPVTCDLVQRAIEEIVEELIDSQQTPRQQPASRHAWTEEELSNIFKDQMRVYETYFESDPEFDTSHARRLCPDLPCPSVDLALLKKLARFAVDENFGWPRKLPQELTCQQLVATLESFPLIACQPGAICLEVCLVGQNAPQLLRFVWNGHLWGRCLEQLPPPSDSLRLTTSVNTLASCISGTTRLIGAIESGDIALDGRLPKQWPTILEQWVNEVRSIITE